MDCRYRYIHTDSVNNLRFLNTLLEHENVNLRTLFYEKNRLISNTKQYKTLKKMVFQTEKQATLLHT